MTLADVIFYLFAGIAALSGLLLAFTRNLIHAGFTLFAVLFGVAGLFVFAQAEFLALMQVVIYVGGILVIILFGIMLTQKVKDLDPGTGLSNLPAGLAIALTVFFALGWMIREIALPQPVSAQIDDVRAIGISTLTDYLLLFELVSILLLAVLIGAAYLTRKPRNEAWRDEA